MAPACPDSPPPQTVTAMSTLPACSTTSRGCLRIILLVSRPKYSSSVRSLTTNSPEPGFMRTRAIDSLRRPVAETISSLAISLGSFTRSPLPSRRASGRHAGARRRAPQHLVLHVDDHPVALDGLLAAHHRLHLKKLREQKTPCGRPLRGGGRYAIRPGVSTDATGALFHRRRAPARQARIPRAGRSSRRRRFSPWPAGRPSAPKAAGRRDRWRRRDPPECRRGSATAFVGSPCPASSAARRG